VKKIVCTKLLTVFLVNILAVPFANGGKKHFIYNSGKGRKKTRNYYRFQRKPNKKRKREKHRSAKKVEQLSERNRGRNQDLQGIKERWFKKAIKGRALSSSPRLRRTSRPFARQDEREKKRSFGKLRRSGRKKKIDAKIAFLMSFLRGAIRAPKLFIPLLILGCFVALGKCQEMQFHHCRPGSYFFDLTHYFSGDYYFHELDCYCELDTVPIWGAVIEKLVCPAFPPLYSDHCKKGPYEVFVSGVNLGEDVTSVVDCECEEDVWLTCDTFFIIEFPRTEPRRSSENKNRVISFSADISPENNMIIRSILPQDHEENGEENNLEKNKTLSRSVLFGFVAGGVGVMGGAACCLPFISKKKIKKIISKVRWLLRNRNDLENNELEYEVEDVTEAESGSEGSSDVTTESVSESELSESETTNSSSENVSSDASFSSDTD